MIITYIHRCINDLKNKINNSPLYGRTFFFLFLMGILLKFAVVYTSYINLNPLNHCLTYFISDIIILAIIQILICINTFINKRRLRIILDIILFFIIFLFCVDIATIYLMQSRVSIMQMLTYASNGGKGFTSIIIMYSIMFIVGGIFSFYISQYLNSKQKSDRKCAVIFTSICLIIYSLVYFCCNDIEYVDNVFSLNIGSIFSHEEYKKGSYEYSDYIYTIQGSGKNLNVILVFGESLSAIDSANVGGNDNLPNFDKIQKDGITFTNFITNGTTSDAAHIATLLGVIPLINKGVNGTPYSGYDLYMPALPEYLNDQGYATTFISAAGLKFLDQRSFLSGAGFQKIIGEEEFKNLDTYTFDSAPDGDLYARTLQEVKNQTGNYFIGLQTISFHKPYSTPKGDTEELALQYSDEELYKFYTSLQDMGFFESGILIIVGDHRMMNPIKEGEYDRFGENRYTRSVATVVGSGINPGDVNQNIIQHTDFYNSIKRLIGSGNLQVDKTYNDIFTNNANRNRGITNSEFYENNRYTVSFIDKSPILFKNISNLQSQNEEIYNYFSAYTNYEFGNNYSDDESSVKIIGHRGTGLPENTFQSFLEAKNLGANGVEFDVSYTKDGQNIVAHGPNLYTSNCKNKQIGDYTFDRISNNCVIQNGEKYLKLKDMLELIDGFFDYYFIELKVTDEQFGRQQALSAIQTIRNLGMEDKVIFISYSDSAKEALSEQDDILWGRDTYNIEDVDILGNKSCQYFLAPYDLLNAEIVQKVKNLGKEIVTYTVNDSDNFQKMQNLGIDIIMTDKIKEITSLSQ